jgi:hypothetical protein
MLTQRSLFGLACRAAALSFLFAGTASLTQAQSTASSAAGLQRPLFVSSAYANPFAADLAKSSSSSSSSYSSNSDEGLPDTTALGHFDLFSKQPPPRRRYGRPNYADSNTNKDGSPKWVGMVGGGFSVPVGNLHKYDTTSWGLQAGAGRNYSKTLAVLLQFDYDHFGLQSSTIKNQEFVYNYYCTPQQQTLGNCSVITNLDANSHVWSFTVDPTFSIPSEGNVGAYFVVGGGFYHKVTNFTLPGNECLDFSCFYVVTVQQNVDHYTSNAFGANGGLGVTWKFSKFSNEMLYAEVRYVFIDNQPRTGLTAQNVGTSFGASYTGTNFYPANSHRTEYFPVKIGIRF